MNKLGLAFLFVWLGAVLLGFVRPKAWLRVWKSNSNFLGKIYGFKAVPESDEIICKIIRRWHGLFLIFGLFVLFMILTSRVK